MDKKYIMFHRMYEVDSGNVFNLVRDMLLFQESHASSTRINASTLDTICMSADLTYYGQRPEVKHPIAILSKLNSDTYLLRIGIDSSFKVPFDPTSLYCIAEKYSKK
jgi:hypothetical protein